jgi:hypothetical protein
MVITLSDRECWVLINKDRVILGPFYGVKAVAENFKKILTYEGYEGFEIEEVKMPHCEGPSKLQKYLEKKYGINN